MKIIDKYLLKSFLNTFLASFTILFFIFILQSIWLFIAELAGKDLDFFTIVRFILYFMPSMVPLVLPLSILLASIMTFGSLAENYEFAAMKSGGISLKRAMQPLFYFTLILAAVAFLFANNIIPEAQFRFINLRKSILQTKPAMAIGEGQFNKIGTNLNIKVEKKSGENGEFLEDITLHSKKSEFSPMNTVIRAKKGVLKSNDDTNLLQLELLDGNYYEDVVTEKFEEKQKMPFAKSSFKKYTINIDLAKLNKVGTEDGIVTNAHNMLTMGQLKYTIDSLETIYNKDVISYSENLNQRLQTGQQLPSNPSLVQVSKTTGNLDKDLFSIFSPDKKVTIKEIAKSNISNLIFSMDGYSFDLQNKKTYINDFWISYYDKIFVAFACIIMFFIGAPLGAIIRKGGLGLPIVFAVIIFITYNFATTFGRKLAGQDGIPPIIGVAAGSLLLTPFAIWLTYRALNDIGASINLDGITKPFVYIFNKLTKSKEEFELEVKEENEQ